MQMYLTIGNRRLRGIGDKAITMAIISIVLMILGVMFRPARYVAAAVIVFYILVSPMEFVWYEVFVLVPFANVFKLNPASTSLFTYLQFIIVAKALLSNRKLNGRFIGIYIIYLAIVIIGGLSNITILLKQAIVPLLIYCFFKTRVKFDKLYLLFSCSVIAASVIATMKEVIPNLSSFLTVIRAWELNGAVYRFSGLYTDPNYYSLTLLVALSCMMVLYNIKKINISFYIYYVVVALFGSMTVSKSFLLMLALLSVLFAVSQILEKKYLWGILLGGALLLAVVLILQGRITLFNNVIGRMTSGDDLTTNRVNIWLRYSEYIFSDVKNIMVGAGVGAGYLNAAAAPHNTYIDMLYYYGAVGCCVFIATCKCAAGRFVKMHRGLTHFIVPLSVCVPFFFLSSLQAFDFSYVVILAVMCYQNRELADKRYIR